MEATHVHNDNLHDRLSMMKMRISSKRTAADMLFSNLSGAKNEHSKESLESILESIKKQQRDEGNLDSTVH